MNLGGLSEFYTAFDHGTPISRVVKVLRREAVKGFYDGRPTVISKLYLNSCKGLHYDTGSLLIFTRDVYHHGSGWFKNPDYERCWHLSLSCNDPETMEPAPHNHRLAMRWLKECYQGDRSKVWAEPPFHQKRLDVWHYRLFCDANWQPILPRKEVYSTKFTPRGWLSYSDLQVAIRLQAKLKMEVMT